MDVYKGGLTQPGKVTYPNAVAEGEVKEVYGGEGAVAAHNGSPAAESGYTTKDFLNDKGYDTGSMEVGRPSNMKTVNPDDISNQA